MFLMNFGLVNQPENPLSQDFKLIHELWKSLSRFDTADDIETVSRNHLYAVIEAILGLNE